MLLLLLGTILIFLGFLLLFWPVSEEKHAKNLNYIREEEANEIEGGAVVMIGPVPLLIGSNPKIALFLMIIALSIIIIWAWAIRGT